MSLFLHARFSRLAASILAGLWLAASPALAADPVPDVCELDGNATGPCSLEIQLGDRPLARTFPFDVPVFLSGMADPSVQKLTLHLFSAKKPFRLAETCEDPLPLAQCADEKHRLSCVLYDQTKKPGAQGKWTFANLRQNEDQNKDEKTADCSLQAQASIWARSSPGDNTFTLRVPPQPANRYFSLFLEVEETPSAEEIAALKAELARALDEAVDKALTNQGGSFTTWADDLHQGICDAVEAAGRKRGVRFKVPDDSLLDCNSPAGDRLRATATSDAFDEFTALFNIRADIRQQLRTILADDALPQDVRDGLGLTLAQVNDSNFVLSPSVLNENAINSLSAEAAKTGLADEISSLKQSLAAYQEMQKITDAIAIQTVTLSGSNIGAFLTRQKAYIAADFGVLYAREVEEALPYMGTNIYFVPVNKQAPLGWKDGWTGKRYSGTVGVTLGTFGKARTEALFSDLNLVTGVGVRLTESMRLGVGAVWFREADKNPLSTDKKTVYSYYGSLSLDYDVNSLIKWFSKLFN